MVSSVSTRGTAMSELIVITNENCLAHDRQSFCCIKPNRGNLELGKLCASDGLTVYIIVGF
jgi:hypothetical protein